MKNIDSYGHLRGESIYVDDIPTLQGTLYASVYASPYAHAKIKSLDLSEALRSDGVIKIITAKDIPGENQIGGIVLDEQLLAEHEVHFAGMPVAVVIAKSEHQARVAREKIKMEVEELPIITSPRVAKEKGHFLVAPRTFSIGDTTQGFSEAAYSFESSASFGGQEHVYLETQGCYSYPLENGGFKVYSSTQGPTAAQKMCARVLGLSMSQIEVDVQRLGGGFGGKEDQASTWACIATLGAYLLKKPVKVILHRGEDMRMTGKRHPYEFDFKIALSKDYKITGYEVFCYQNGGAAADLSPAIMERTLLHGGGSYFLPNGKITVYSCKTNLPPNTAFRGFGGPQGMFAIESAIQYAADELGIDKVIIQRANLLQEGDHFPYGQVAKKCEAVKCFDKVITLARYEEKKRAVEAFNSANCYYKKGLSIFPLCFGISFTNTMMNQARSLVHIYTDGTIAISTGVIEMGQAVNTKIAQVAALVLGVTTERIRMNSTNTTRVANSSPTAASSGADLNGHATRIACNILKDRLLEVASKELKVAKSDLQIINEKVCLQGSATTMSFEELVMKAYLSKVCLSEYGHYATPEIFFDKSKEKGHPFAYHVYGSAITEVTVDCVRGTYVVDSVDIVHDFGKSMNLDIDMGQVEGALMQGIGLMTIEEQSFNDAGKNMTDSLSMYKVPDIYFAPKQVNVTSLGEDADNLAILGSKAVGEPPLMYGIGTYFSIHSAVKAFNKNSKFEFRSPYTHERCLMNLYKK